MEYRKIAPTELESGRLDAEFYKDIFLQTYRMLREFTRGTLEGVREPDIPIRRGIDMPVFSNKPDDPVLVPIGAFTDPGIDFTALQNISDEQHHKFKGSQIIAGDLLIAMGGYVGKVAICPAEHPVANIGRHTARVTVDPTKCDSGFLYSFISCKHGQRQFQRQVTGAVQSGINLEDLREIEFPLPHPDAQAYIGNKVRQAEMLRARARELIQAATHFFQSLHSKTEDGWRGSWRSKCEMLDEARLDAWFYAPAPTNLVERLEASDTINLSCHLKLIKQSNFDSGKSISYFEIGNLDVSTGCAWSSKVEPDAIPSRAQRSVRCWDILVSTVRPERKNVAIVGPGQRGQLVASSGFSVLRASTPEDAAFYCWFLRSDAGTDQMLRWNTGAAYPAIDDNVPLQVLAPHYEPDIRRSLGKVWMQIPELQLFASRVVKSAKFLVEALIERRVTEDELVAAYSDSSTDRDLMQRLTVDGFDVSESSPLFEDLDRLQELLDEANSSGGSDEV